MYKKYLNFPLEIKSHFSNGKISGYASVFEIIDLHNDMLSPGAFAESIKNQYKQDIKFLWQHNIAEPIGVISHIEEDNYGLYIEAKLLLQVARALEAYCLIESGSVRGLSIGYYPTEYYFDDHQNIRIITEVQLKEISLVTFPSNRNALITNYTTI